MKTIYIYLLDTLADWELGFVTAELHSKRFFKKDAPEITLKTVSCSNDSITTMGGMKITPDCLPKDIVMDKTTTLLLPGGDTWSDSKHHAIIDKATELLSLGATVCAICGATVVLANRGLLNNRPHTSNGAGFLEMFCANYTGTDFFIDQPSVSDGNLITASCTGALPWAKCILKHLEVFSDDTLEAWFNYFSTGNAQHFYALMQTLPINEQ